MTVYELLDHGLPENRADLRAFLGLVPQEKDTLHYLSRQRNVDWTPKENNKEALKELVQLDPQNTVEDLKMLAEVLTGNVRR